LADIQKLLQNDRRPQAIRESEEIGYNVEITYFEKVLSHRMFQYAMSRYKLMRYQPENVKDSKLNW